VLSTGLRASSWSPSADPIAADALDRRGAIGNHKRSYI
jgi:hypothetical protein